MYNERTDNMLEFEQYRLDLEEIEQDINEMGASL
jgi:hypothetical protein